MGRGDHSTTTQLTGWWQGRLGRRFLQELVILFALLSLYRLGRYLGRDHVEAAFNHARELLRIERHMGLDTERGLQSTLLPHLWIIRFLNRYYATMHFPSFVAFVVVAYAKAPALYRRLRILIISVTGVALLVQIGWPLAPPRMLPGFVDTVARYGPSIYSKPGVASVANQYAAMPSLHVGWAIILAYGLWQMTDKPWRWIGVVHAVLTTLAVVVTANHYWMDGIVAAIMIVVAARLIDRRMASSPPALQDSAPA